MPNHLLALGRPFYRDGCSEPTDAQHGDRVVTGQDAPGTGARPEPLGAEAAAGGGGGGGSAALRAARPAALAEGPGSITGNG